MSGLKFISTEKQYLFFFEQDTPKCKGREQ